MQVHADKSCTRISRNTYTSQSPLFLPAKNPGPPSSGNSFGSSTLQGEGLRLARLALGEGVDDADQSLLLSDSDDEGVSACAGRPRFLDATETGLLSREVRMSWYVESGSR